MPKKMRHRNRAIAVQVNRSGDEPLLVLSVHVRWKGDHVLAAREDFVAGIMVAAAKSGMWTSRLDARARDMQLVRCDAGRRLNIMAKKTLPERL